MAPESAFPHATPRGAPRRSPPPVSPLNPPLHPPPPPPRAERQGAPRARFSHGTPASSAFRFRPVRRAPAGRCRPECEGAPRGRSGHGLLTARDAVVVKILCLVQASRGGPYDLPRSPRLLFSNNRRDGSVWNSSAQVLPAGVLVCFIHPVLI